MRKCRYDLAGCRAPVTHLCAECTEASSGEAMYYCTAHAERHDRLVRECGGMIFAQRLTGTDSSESPDSKEAGKDQN